MSDNSDTEQQIDTMSRTESETEVRKPRVYKSSFTDEQCNKTTLICPFKNCGRKFLTENQLKIHVERRHNAEERKAEQKYDNKPTPMPTKSKVPQPPSYASTSSTQASKEPMSQDFSAKPKMSSTQESQAQKIVRGHQQQQPTKKMMTTERPQTAVARPKIGKEQADLISQMHGAQAVKGGGMMARPRTAATTSVFDESRIKDKLKFLEDLEARIELDITGIQEKSANFKPGEDQPGIRLDREMILTGAMCDELSEVNTVMLRDKNIEFVDDNPKGGLKLEELGNIECFYASNNKIKDLYGIGTLGSLLEINLNNNRVVDMTGLEELTRLEKLYINYNEIVLLDPIENLKSLKVLQISYNKVIAPNQCAQILTNLPKLKELSIAGNPCSKELRFTYELILKMPKLKMMNDEAIKEMDRDVAQMHFEMNGIKFFDEPVQGVLKSSQSTNLETENNEQNQKPQASNNNNNNNKKKSVSFRGLGGPGDQADTEDLEDNSWQHAELQKALRSNRELEEIVEKLNMQLNAKNYKEVYIENERMRKELRNMDILLVENQELKEDLDRMRRMPYDDRVKEVGQENAHLRQRNGELLIENSNLIEEVTRLKKGAPLMTPASSARPQTAAARLSAPTTQEEINMGELANVIQENQQRIQDLHQDFKNVYRATDDTYVNIRKVKGAPQGRPVPGRQTPQGPNNAAAAAVSAE